MDILFIAGKKKNHFQGLVGYLYLTILDHYCLAVHMMNCLPSQLPRWGIPQLSPQIRLGDRTYMQIHTMKATPIGSYWKNCSFHPSDKNYIPVDQDRGFPGDISGKEPAFQCRRHKRCGFDPCDGKILAEGMATHSSTPAWRIPWTGKPGRLQSMGLQRVGNDWSDLAHTQNLQYTCLILLRKFDQNVKLSTLGVVTYSVQFSRLVMSNSLRPCGLQHSRPPCPSPTPGAYSNSCPSSW